MAVSGPCRRSASLLQPVVHSGTGALLVSSSRSYRGHSLGGLAQARMTPTSESASNRHTLGFSRVGHGRRRNQRLGSRSEECCRLCAANSSSSLWAHPSINKSERSEGRQYANGSLPGGDDHLWTCCAECNVLDALRHSV